MLRGSSFLPASMVIKNSRAEKNIYTYMIKKNLGTFEKMGAKGVFAKSYAFAEVI